MAARIDARALRDMLMDALGAELEGYEYEPGDEEIGTFYLHLPWLPTRGGRLFKVTVEPVTLQAAWPSVHAPTGTHPTGQFVGQAVHPAVDGIRVDDGHILCRSCAEHVDPHDLVGR